MKAKMYDWYGSSDKMKELGYPHNSIAKDWQQAMKVLFDAGLNVMLLHNQSGLPVLCVSSKRFGQY